MSMTRAQNTVLSILSQLKGHAIINYQLNKAPACKLNQGSQKTTLGC